VLRRLAGKSERRIGLGGCRSKDRAGSTDAASRNCPATAGLLLLIQNQIGIDRIPVVACLDSITNPRPSIDSSASGVRVTLVARPMASGFVPEGGDGVVEMPFTQKTRYPAPSKCHANPGSVSAVHAGGSQDLPLPCHVILSFEVMNVTLPPGRGTDSMSRLSADRSWILGRVSCKDAWPFCSSGLGVCGTGACGGTDNGTPALSCDPLSGRCRSQSKSNPTAGQAHRQRSSMFSLHIHRPIPRRFSCVRGSISPSFQALS